MKPTTTEEKWQRYVRWLIWTYFWLLLGEGALRKWVLPGLSNPLLVVRDPLLLLIYMFSIRARVFPKNAWTIVLVIIAAFCTLTTFINLSPYLPPLQIAGVTAYGIHADFFHLPLIFVMARVLRIEDVKKFGWWTLVVLLPMTLLMVAQFRAAPDSFLNRTAGGEGEMMAAALGKVRTAGPFSFVIGVVAYYALATGYLVWGILRQGTFKNWLLYAAGGALVIGVAVSGSRSVIGACGVVVASLLVVIFLRPDIVNRFGQVLLAVIVFGFIISRTPIFKEGAEVLSARFNDVAAATEQSIAGGMISRVFSGFGEDLYVFTKSPVLGYGLGLGTNAGAKFLTGHAMFLLSESEWSRIFLESGEVFGLAFIIWRCWFVLRTGWLCTKSVRVGNLLPILLFSSAFLPMINGQFGQPTLLGFTVFVSGLALAAMNDQEAGGPISLSGPVARAKLPPKRRGRSAYAERMHGPPAEQGNTNGATDR